jgi:hypothetical protein
VARHTACSGDGQRTRRLEDRARIFEYILIAAQWHRCPPDDLIHQFAAQPESLRADLLHRHAIGEQPDMVERDAPFGFYGAIHRIGIHRLHSDDPDLGAQLLDVSRHAGDQPAAADGNEDRVDRLGMLAQYLHRDGALSGDHVGVVVGMHEGQFVLLLQFQRVLIGI